MAFCTQCGAFLRENAHFCTQCGASCRSNSEFSESISAEINKTPQAVFSAPSSENGKEAASVQSENKYVSSSGTAQERPLYVPPFTAGGYIPPQIELRRNSGSKKTAVAALGIVGVLIIALALIIALGIHSSKNSVFGYWESVEIDFGNGIFVDEYLGNSMKGVMKLQINEDGTICFESAFSAQHFEGNWIWEGSELRVRFDDMAGRIRLEGKQLILDDGNMRALFEKSTGDIYGGAAESPTAKAEQAPTQSVAGSGDVSNGEFHISIVGAQQVEDYDGSPAVRMFFEFTNNFDYPVAADDVLDYELYQDGTKLSRTYSWTEDEIRYNDILAIRPGITILCACDFPYSPNGGSLDFSVFGWQEEKAGGVVTASYMPQALPGAPAPYVIKPVADPKWTLRIPSESEVDEYYVSVKDAAKTTDAIGNDALRVNYEFTNSTDSPISMGDALFCRAYQDGIQLLEVNAHTVTKSDEAMYEPVQPGQTISCSCVYRLRNLTSAVEAEVESAISYFAVGQTYYID